MNIMPENDFLIVALAVCRLQKAQDAGTKNKLIHNIQYVLLVKLTHNLAQEEAHYSIGAVEGCPRREDDNGRA